MAIITKIQLLNKIKEYIGEKDDDLSLSLLEDTTDTLGQEEKDWEAEYKTLDANWRKRYRERFESAIEEPSNKDKTDSPIIPEENEEKEKEKNYSYDNLFDGGKEHA